MSDPVIIQQQRQLLRSFRNATQTRIQTEQAATARHRSELAAAEKALKQVQQSAQAVLTKTTNESETRHAAERKKAEESLASVRSQSNAGLQGTQSRYQKARSALEQANLLPLIKLTQPQTITINEKADPKREFSSLVTTSEKVFTRFEIDLKDLNEAREQAAQRGRLLWQIAGIAAFLLFIVGFFSWQAQQTRLQEQSTATAVAMQAATATSIVQSTATATTNLFKPLEERFAMRFVIVPAGEFTMGSPDNVGNNSEHPQSTVNLDSFLISITEVTNAQYRPFVEAGGYTKEALWTKAGWEWRRKISVTQPDCWYDKTWNKPDYPVVCVSWYEAIAYTRWLSEETGIAVRLPTEAEWEKAARGTDARTYPWGEQSPTAELANFAQNVGHTSAVGSYPLGASPYGVLDMTGNVMEWTNSDTRGYPYNAKDGREEISGTLGRRLRGGSWRSPSDVRASIRPWEDPFQRKTQIGFRVAFSAPSGF